MSSKMLLFSAFVLFIECSQGTERDSAKKIDMKKEILPPCQACKTLVNTFLKGMGDTNKKHFGGGDTAWEEEKLGDYAKSEVRLIEIQESLCSDIQRGQQQCYQLAEEWEPLLEEWWFKEQDNYSDLFTWLCIKKIEYCCPENHFGPECKPCDGFPGSICSNNGKCKGAGTRKGNGMCVCNQGYSGPKCNECAHLYYESYKDGDKLLCSKCHDACKESCVSSGPQGCKKCKEGWMKDATHGCVDLNECTTTNSCKNNEFCVNNEGSYSCLACDQSCNSCYGYGSGNCKSCNEGFTLRDGHCVDKEKSLPGVEWTRYFTYMGFCISTCIIFKRNAVIASLVGLSIALYISVSEYMLYTISHES